MEMQSQALKRQRDDENNQRKSQRMASSAEPDHSTKIIDLNDDCLRKIFGHLDLQSLFSVAVANEWLRPAARDVYRRKFGSHEVYISDCNDIRPNTRANARKAQFKTSVLTEYDSRHSLIEINGLRPCLLYLRCFGPAIADLWVDYNKSKSKRYNYVHQYINEYCSESLTQIAFYQMPNIAIEQFQKVFVHVEYVFIWDSHLGAQWLNVIVECFPNLRHLKIDQVKIVVRSDGLKKSFKHLEHLEDLVIVNCKKTVTKNLAINLLQGVHRLKNFVIQFIDEQKDPITVLLDMIKTNPQITELTYRFRSVGYMPESLEDVKRIVAEHAALVEIQLEDYQFSAEDACTLIRQLNSLQRFEFQMHALEHAKFVSQQMGNIWPH